MKTKEQILHKHLLPFELYISEMGLKNAIEFENAMINAISEYANQPEDNQDVKQVQNTQILYVVLGVNPYQRNNTNIFL